MVAISLSGSGEGPGRGIPRGYSTTVFVLPRRSAVMNSLGPLERSPSRLDQTPPMLRKLASLVPSREPGDALDPVDWGYFFAATTEKELEDLVMQRPAMNEPMQALTQLSDDERARFAAMDRERTRVGWQITLGATHEAGRAEGKIEGKADSLFAVLGARGLSVSQAQRERVLGTHDPALLDRWLLRAITAQVTEEVFES